MKTKLLEYFGDKIIITDINGEPNVVTATATLQEFHKHQDGLAIKEDQRNMIKAEAKLIQLKTNSNQSRHQVTATLR